MRIALTNPYCWPQRRRGSERLLHDLSRHLAGRGHEVTTIASAPGPRSDSPDGPVRRITVPQREPLFVPTRWCSFLHRFAFQVADEVARGGFDAVHSLNYHDAWGVLRARREGARPRLVYTMAGIATRRYFRLVPLDGWMFRTVLREAEAVLSVTRHAQATMLAEFGRTSLHLPSPTDLAPFLATPKPAPDGRLRLLFVGDLTERRKGAVLLARAFARVRMVRGEATLAYSGHADAATMAAIRAQVPGSAQADVTFHGVGDVAALPALYAGASVFVNPAVWEAQGMVFVEALAAGTPVVGCDHGGTPDVVSDPAIGRLFAPGAIRGRAASDDVALARAILEAAELAMDPATAPRCRAHAGQYGWDRLGPAYEAALAG